MSVEVVRPAMATRSDDGRGDEAEGRIDRQAVFEELFDTLAVARPGLHPHRMATHLLRRESGSNRLVALVDAGRRAVFDDADHGALLAVPFDEHGLADEATVEVLATAGPATWVARNGADATWVHPRYRPENSM